MTTARRSLPREEPEAAGEDAVRGSRGVSDPVSAAPDFARRPAPMGSLTPRLRASFVRTNVPARLSSTRHAAWSCSESLVRRAQRRETVAHSRNFFPTGGRHAID